MTTNFHNRGTRPLRVIIVGGGIGGLSAAIALRRHGHDVVVLERARRLDPVGAGITLFANAMDALRHLGVDEAVAATGASVLSMTFLTSEGQQLTHLPSELVAGATAIHRGDLQTVLQNAAGAIHLGAEIESIHQTADRVVARASDGSEEHGDLLVGADGVRSIVRNAIATPQPRYAGYTVWRGVSPVALDAGHLTESWGAGERFGLGDIGSQAYWYATAKAPEGGSDSPREPRRN